MEQKKSTKPVSKPAQPVKPGTGCGTCRPAQKPASPKPCSPEQKPAKK